MADALDYVAHIMGWDKATTKEQKQPKNGENGPSDKKSTGASVAGKIKSRAQETKESLKYK